MNRARQRRACAVVAAALASALQARCAQHQCAPPDMPFGEYCAVPCGTAGLYCGPDGQVAFGDGSLADASATDAGNDAQTGCPDGAMPCASGCVAPGDPSNCGSCGVVCPGVLNGRSVCVGGGCAVQCATGFEAVGPLCLTAVAVPRAIAPISASHVTSWTPTLQWQHGAASDGTRVTLCRDRAMTRACATFDATGDAGRPPAALDVGAWFWTVRGLQSGRSGDPSPSWEFVVGAVGSTADRSWGSVNDFNGDGFADHLIVATIDTTPTGTVAAYPGSSRGLAALPVMTLGDAAHPAAAGSTPLDVDGNGTTDLFVVATTPPTTASPQVLLQPRDARSAATSVALLDLDAEHQTSSPPIGVGDQNGDGYGDVLAFALPRPGASVDAETLLYNGSPAGPTAPPTVTTAADRYVRWIVGGGDADGDGYVDFLSATSSSAGPGTVSYAPGTAAGAPDPTVTLILHSSDADAGAFGFASTMLGDLDGDGRVDPVVSAPGLLADTGRVYVYLTRGGSVPAMPTLAITGPDGAGGRFGEGLSSNGDVDGDGFDDLVVGAPGAVGNAGRVYLFRGGFAGPVTSPATTLDRPAGAAGRFGALVF